MSVADAPDPFDLTDRVAVVTGAGTGIGRATAYLFAEHGADVVLAGRKVEPLEATAAGVRERGRTASVVPTDVKDAAASEALVEQAAAWHGRIDILVNNAGGSRAKDYESWTLQDFDDMVSLNLRSAWVLSCAAVAHMPAGGGIVNISSAASLRPVTHSAPYGAAKAALNNLTATMAVDLAPRGIRVNAIAVGIVKSEGYLRAMHRLGLDPDETGGQNALGRPGTPEEIAWPILFLVSRASTFMTGETMHVGGGPIGWIPA